MRTRGYYPSLTPEQHKARRATGWAIADAGGNMADLARAEGMSSAAIHYWLKNHPELHRALLDGRRTYTLSAEKSEHRLYAVAIAQIEGRSRRTVADELGITPAALCLWLRKREGELFDLINEITNERRAA